MDCRAKLTDMRPQSPFVRGKPENNQKRTPIVALTADALDSARQHCFDVGMDDFLSKPLRKKEPQTVLQKWLD